MIVKFFASKTGGSVASIDYLLDKRTEQNTARILQGDEKTTRNLIKSMEQKHKACVGCLSFEESNIDEKLKFEIMQSFENMLLTPEMQGRYNILWVEHIDKGRLELNFVIPKIDLESKKAFNPYFHMADMKRKDLWTDFINIKYNFSNPKDPAKENTLQGNKKEKELIKDYEILDNILHEQVKQNLINSRKELIAFLELENIQVTRQGKDYIGIKLPDSKKAKRFKGGIYDEQFTSTRELETILKRKTADAREFNQRDNRKKLERIKQELDDFIQSKTRFYRELHNRTSQKEYQSNNTKNKDNDNNIFMRNVANDDFKLDCMVSVDKTLSSIQIDNKGSDKWSNIHRYEQNYNTQGKQYNLHSNSITQGNEYDNIRSRAYSRNREIAESNERLTKFDCKISEQRSRIIERKRATIELFRKRESSNADARERISIQTSNIESEFQKRARKIRIFFQELRTRISNKINEFANTIKQRIIEINQNKAYNPNDDTDMIALRKEYFKEKENQELAEKTIETKQEQTPSYKKNKGFDR